MADAAAVLEEVRGVGRATAAALAARFGTLEELALASNEELTEVKGVGPAMARAIQQAVAEAVAAESHQDVAAEETADEDVAVITSTAEEPAEEQLAAEEVTEPVGAPAEEPAAQPIVEAEQVPEVAHHDRPEEAEEVEEVTAEPAPEVAAAVSQEPAVGEERPEGALPLRPRGPALPPPTSGTPEEAGTETGPMDADVIPLHRVREGVEDTAQDLKGAVDAMWGVVTAAVEAGKAELPEVRRELQATMDALLDTARTLVEAARDMGKRT